MTMRLLLVLRRPLVRLSALPFRLIAYVLHATGLDRIYKPRFTRYSALLDLTDEVVAQLPQYSQTMTGARTDPMNLIFVGSEQDLRLVFKTAGWNRAHPANPLVLLYAALAALIHRRYDSGPFTPHYVNIGLQDMAFQRPTMSKNFRARHHLRIWRSGVTLPGDKRVWVGAASFDRSLKLQFRPPWINHELDPNLDKERDFVVRSLEDQGALRLKSVAMTEVVLASQPRKNPSGNRYYTDGQAVVVQV